MCSVIWCSLFVSFIRPNRWSFISDSCRIKISQRQIYSPKRLTHGHVPTTDVSRHTAALRWSSFVAVTRDRRDSSIEVVVAERGKSRDICPPGRRPTGSTALILHLSNALRHKSTWWHVDTMTTADAVIHTPSLMLALYTCTTASPDGCFI